MFPLDGGHFLAVYLSQGRNVFRPYASSSYVKAFQHLTLYSVLAKMSLSLVHGQAWSCPFLRGLVFISLPNGVY